VITTRNLLDAVVRGKSLKRFVAVSCLTVYSNENLPPGALLDETCELERRPHLRGEACCYAKVRQEELLEDYAEKYDIPSVILRPGVVYGPGNRALTGRVGIQSFGMFLHLGGSNIIPLSYVDNCAEAVVLAGLKKGADGKAFNVVDDDLPTSRAFLRMYKKHVKRFPSLPVPHRLSYFLCYAWERYSARSQGQLPPVFNRKKWSNYWKGNVYSNQKLKDVLGWRPRIGFEEAARRYCAYQKQAGGDR
jgi:nucleoside-diphosphate-sugar epimerase